MSGKTMSDWISQPEAPRLIKKLASDKLEDMDRLRKSDLPQFDYLSLPYNEFSEQNIFLTSFFHKYSQQGYSFCVRAIPTDQGLEKGYTRKPMLFIPDFDEAKDFLENIVQKGEERLWNVGISNMASQHYGGVIISSLRRTLAEIATRLDKLTAGEETPLATYEKPSTHLRGRWLKKADPNAEKWLKRAIKMIGSRQGYFEFVVSQIKSRKEIKFLDFKTKPEYLI